MSKRKEAEDAEEEDTIHRVRDLLGKRVKTHRDFTRRFLNAVKRGNIKKCKDILEECPKDWRRCLLQYRSRVVSSFLHVAAERNQPQVINWLLSDEGGRLLGFYALTRTDNEETALHFAVGEGNIECCKAIVNGCRVDNGDRQEMLDAVDNLKRSVLHLAASSGQTSVVSWLLSSEEGGGRSLGFNSVLATTKDGKTALHLAAEKGHLECCKAIVNGCRIDNGERQEMLNALNLGHNTILHSAASNGSTAVVSWLLSSEEGGGRSLGFNSVHKRAKYGELTALHLAAEKGHLECCKAIVNGCRVDDGERQEMLSATTVEGWTALHFAAYYGGVAVASWLMSDEEGGGRSLGFNVLARTKEGDTALHLAAQEGRFECFVAIVNGCRTDNGERQEMINAVDNHGMTILHLAVDEGNLSLIVWILSEDGGRAAGFNLVTARTSDGMCTALNCAIRHQNPDTLRTLLSNCTSQERTNLFLSVGTRGWTALHRAVSQNQLDAILKILSQPECAMIVNRKDKEGMTALHRAIIGGIDKKSRNEWAPRGLQVDIGVIRALLGMNSNSPSSSSSSSSTTIAIAKEWIDPNIGLGL